MSKKQIPEEYLQRYQEICLFIKNWRINECHSQCSFSKLASVHVNTIQKLETLKTNLSILTLFNCIDAMGMTLEEFFEGVE